MHIYERIFKDLYNRQESNLTPLHKLLRIDCKSCEDCKVNLLLEYVSTRWFIVLSSIITYYYFKLYPELTDFLYIRDLVRLQAKILIAEDNKEALDNVLRYIELRQQLIQYIFKHEVFSNRSR